MGRYSLHVGINYVGSASGPILHGCVNDAKLWQTVAKTRLQIPVKNMTTLVETQATKKRIIEELEKLISDKKEDDLLLFTYSGHGSQLPDDNRDERDKLDETLVPYDASPFIAESQIRDDELATILKKLNNKTHLVVILDCCYSGTASRGIINGGNGYANRKNAVRFMPPAFEVTTNYDALLTPNIVGKRSRPNGKVKIKNTVVASELNHILISGCKDTELSNDMPIGNTYFGALSYHLVLSGEDKSWNTTYKKWVEDTARKVLAVYPDQTPQLEVPSARVFEERVFGL